MEKLNEILKLIYDEISHSTFLFIMGWIVLLVWFYLGFRISFEGNYFPGVLGVILMGFNIKYIYKRRRELIPHIAYISLIVTWIFWLYTSDDWFFVVGLVTSGLLFLYILIIKSLLSKNK